MNSNTKRIIKIVITIIMSATLIIQMVVTSNLSKKINLLQGELATLRNEIPSSVNITTTIEERKALFEKIEHNYGTADFDTNTIPYHLKVLSTTINDDMKISFVLNNTEYELMKNGDYYETTIHLGLFEQNNGTDDEAYFKVILNGEKNLHRYNDIVTDTLFTNCIEQLVTGYRNLSYSESGGKMTINYTLDIRSEKNSFLSNYEDIIDISKVELITEFNGEIIEHEDVTKELNKASSPVFQSLTRKTYDGSFDKDTIHIYFVTTYENGYVQKQTLALRSPNDTEKGYYDSIYDANGNLLFDAFGAYKFKLYEGEELKIAVVGEIPQVDEKQIKFVKATFDQMLNNSLNNYDAVIITEENLIEAAKEEYTEVYLQSSIPFFFMGTHTHVSFTSKDVEYEDWMNWSKGNSYAIGILNHDNDLKTRGYGLYNDEMKNLKEVYTRIFKTIEEIK